MAQDVFTTIARVQSLKRLATLEQNIRAQKATSPEIEEAIEARYAEFGYANVT